MPTIYTCPMHPGIQKNHEGLCEECGMRLIPQKEKSTKSEHAEHGDFNKHQGHSVNIFRTKFWVSLVLSVPIILYSDILFTLFGFQAPAFPGSVFLPTVLSTIIFFYGGSVFLTSAFRELKAGLPGMMTLISMAISVAYFYSLAIVYLGGGETLFWELATLITVMLLGHWMEMRAVSSAQSALKELSKLLPDTAEVMRNGKTEVIPLSQVRVGDRLLVKPGGKIPTDGLVVEGISDVDESIATGESKPVAKEEGSEVIAGTSNGDGSLQIKVTEVGEKTFLAGVMRLVAEAESSKSRLQMLSDRAAYYLTIIAIVTGGITLAVWLPLASPAFAVERMVAVLVIACPHALGLAIPLVASISTTTAAKNGFLVKRRLALEAARNIDIVLFDKTGTLTKGSFGVDTVIPAASVKEAEVLQIAASIDSHSAHPIAKATVEEAKKRGIDIVSISDYQRIPGKGAQAKVESSEVFIGSQSLLDDLGLKMENTLQTEVRRLSKEGKTIIFLVRDQILLGAIALADVIREESREAVKTLHNLGIQTAMITGDSEEVAKWAAKELGMEEYFSRVLPAEKSKKVKELQKRGLKVAMVGDGVNDAPALTQADIGIAIGAGTNVAIESAGIILVSDDPRNIAKIIRLSRFTYAKMMQNLFWATGYNIIAIPLAAGILASRGIFLEPALAAVFMSLSTVIVAVNAVTLKRKKI